MQSRKFKWARCLALAAVVWGAYAMARPVDEVMLTLGEPYEQVRKQSRSTLPPARRGIFWGGFVTRPARFRFTARGYSFVTPAAKFLYVGTDASGKVESVTLSPQIESLPLDQAMSIVQDLQSQLLQHGWRPMRDHRFPPIADTPAAVASIRRGDDPKAIWHAAGQYQVALDIRRFAKETDPGEERYLITLELRGASPMDD